MTKSVTTPVTKVNSLDPLSFPLRGQQLIEASAGTGKTYTITALYLRLLLGQGDLGEQPLGPDQILVVTFTEAATEELRDRIRQRIVEARQAFLQDQVGDPFLAVLKARTTEPEQAVKLLEQAARQMDEAAIFTIHGFCQRMLKRHAFESGSLFDTELTQDDQSLIRSAVLDFWRHSIYPLDAELIALVLNVCWHSPDDLIRELRGLLSRTGLQLQPDLADLDLASAYQQRLQQLRDFKQAWQANNDDLAALIQQSDINKRSYTKSSVPKWLGQVDAYVDSERLEPGKNDLAALARFQRSALEEKTASGVVPEHPLFEQLEQLLSSPVPVREILLGQALRDVSRRLAQAKQQYQLQTFDDLLTGLHQALAEDQSGALAAAIRTQFPVAMIDEFQDTDPLQYGIFSDLYSDPQSSALIMIGDPKQAIYAFRGADIFTYIQARRSVSETYTLDTNWRSTAPMVEAVNKLFMMPPSAFIYDDDIPFTPVKAADKNAKRLTIQKQEPAALTLWYSADEVLNKSQYQACFAQATAAEIHHLLTGEAQLGERAVEGGDIAVLVRDRFEAEEVRRALELYQHPCVYLSNQDSVFNSLEALDLALILAAIENPHNERALKAALATELLQLNMQELDNFSHDEQAWEAVIAEFSGYRERWSRHGVLPMLSDLLHQRELSRSLLQQRSGERCLTNVLHLAELLQQASSEVEGSTGLIRWFNEQIANASSASDDQILRLESERNLVTIVTVHKSKGLEYPIVFLPFGCSFKETKTAFYHNEQGGAVLDMSAGEDALAQAEQERLAEDLRLLYVALTRSVCRCYVGISEIRIGNSPKSRLADSALGYLLLQQGQELGEALEQLQQSSSAIEVIPPVSGPVQYSAQAELFPSQDNSPAELQARSFNTTIDRSWRVSSYSALSRHSTVTLPELPGLDLEVAAEPQQPVEEILVEQDSIFTFPKGANAGTFLHSVFEEISFPDYHDTQAHAAYQQQISEQLTLAGYEVRWLPVIDQLVQDVLAVDLDGNGLKLAAVADQDRLVEMEFMIRAADINVATLETLIRSYDPLAKQARPLGFEPFKGMLKGFIDLLFRSDGRYYVLDYKSNHLGYSADCYHQQALEQAMVEHRYDLQYLLYSLAVHRLLKQRVPDYSYEHHFGGIYYLFLRGVNADNRFGVFSCRPEEALIEQLDQMFAGESDYV